MKSRAPRAKAGGPPQPGPDLIDRLAATLQDRDRFIEELLYVENLRAEIVPFRLNAVQRKIRQAKAKAVAEGRPRHYIVLKARRVGVTTLEQAESFHEVCTKRNHICLTIAHTDKAAEVTFRTVNTFYNHLDPRFRPARLTESSKKDLNLPLMNSLYWMGSARTAGIGRGTRLDRVQWTEVAHTEAEDSKKRNLLSGISQAAKYGEVVLESTANGVGDLFHSLWLDAESGRSDWTPIFIPWFLDPENSLPLGIDQARELEAALDDHEKMLRDRKGISLSQLAWRRAAKASPELRDNFDQEYPEDPATAFIASGPCFFDKTLLRRLLDENGQHQPVEVRQGGELVVWKLPEAGHKYVAASDVGEGVAHGDWSVTVVMDVRTMEQCARLRGRWTPADFGERSAALASAYNEALLGPERNNHGHSMLNTLLNTVHYKNLYYHREYDAHGKVEKVLGWPTNLRTRPIMLDDLRTAVEKRMMPVKDRVLLEEALTFVPNRTGKYEAREGCFDDDLMAWAIALQLRQAGDDTDPATVGPSEVLMPRIFSGLPGSIF